MKKIVILALTGAVVIALVLPVVALGPPAQVNFAGAKRKPAVVFDHAAHEQLAADCKTCHHMGVGNGKCNGCHGVATVAPTFKRAMHKSCRGCHTRMKVANYKDCGFCHK